MKHREPTVIDFVLAGSFLLLNIMLFVVCDEQHRLSISQFVLWLAFAAFATPSAFRIGAASEEMRRHP